MSTVPDRPADQPPPAPIAARLRSSTAWLAAAVAAVGVVVLVGWATGSAALKSVVPGMVSMKVNTALGLALLAVALACLGRPRAGPRLAFAGCLAAVVALAGATLAEYALGVDLRIDTLFVLDPDSPRFPGRPAPATLASLLGLAAALWLLQAGRLATFSQLLLLAVATAPLASLGGYLYGAPGMYRNAPYPAIALNTSTALALLCAGALFARADRGLMGIVTSASLAGSLARKLLPAAVGVPFLTGLLVLSGERAGLYATAFGSALLVAACAVFFAGAVCWAVTLLWRAEAERGRARAERAAAERDRARSERKVGEGEQRLRIALETAGLGSWQVELPSGVIECSARHRANLGLPPAGPLARDRMVAALHPDDRGRVVASMGRALAERTDHHDEYRTVWPDGSVRWIVASGRGIYGDDGAPTRMVGVTLDVTDRKAAEAERERLLDAERRARDEADRANRMKDEFLATVSHELRTPLNAILGWAQVLRASDDPADRAQGMEAIERNARAQVQIIEDLLDMGRIVSGKVRLAVRPMDLSDVVEAGLESLRPAADAKGVRLQKVLDPAAGPVSGDPDRMQQVVWNLLSNAIKFTPKGGLVRVTLQRVASQVEVVVADTGEGIRPEFLPHAFERFRQGDSSTTRRHGGLGLGLAIVKNIVELHGGTVAAESAGAKQGSTFRVALPLMPLLPLRAADPGPERTSPAAAAIDADGGVAIRAAETRTPEPQVPSLAGVRVLVVDDEPDSRRLVQRMLEARDATATIAGSVDEAMTRFGGGHATFDVIISDIGMPDRDGYDLIQTVRRMPGDQGGRTPAVALTAYAQSDDRARAMLAGFDVHVAKPVNPGELCAVVARLARRSA